MAHLTSHGLQQLRAGVSPFDTSNRGFDVGWWGNFTFGGIETRQRLYTFMDEVGNEVARARLVVGETLYDPMGNGVLARQATEVLRLEVHAERRCPRRGIGRAVVRELERIHHNDLLYAFAGGDPASEDARMASKFWRATGWEFIPAPEGSRAAPLFLRR